MSKDLQMKQVEQELVLFKKSPLYTYRIKNSYIPVIGEGNLDANIIFIGEAPGKSEALSGKPFCGASGKVLDQLLGHINTGRSGVYITNIVKDRPQENRDPTPDEIALYAPFLIRQLEIIKPKVIATLGRFSMQFVLKHFNLEKELDTISNIHGKIFKIKAPWGTVKIIPLYHPAVAVYNRKRFDELKCDIKKLL